VGPELLSPIQRHSAKTQNGLSLVRAREVAVETRTKIVNAVRGIVKSSGHRQPTSATSSFARKAKEACPGVLKPTLLHVVEDLTREVELYDKLVAQAGRPSRKSPPGGACHICIQPIEHFLPCVSNFRLTSAQPSKQPYLRHQLGVRA
jgi:transposase